MKEKVIFQSNDYAELIVGKDDQELKDIAEKHFIKLPARDLAIFKCIFAYVDKENLNGCTLPKAEAEVALASLTGKAVDFDHYRRTTVGHWLEAKIEGDKVIAYGVFYKGNHQEAYDELHQIMEKSELGVSFEAWGDKSGTERHYSLSNIEFAGGAMLPTTKPAFPGAKVLEMANERRKKIQELHESSFSIYDYDVILRMCMEAKAPSDEDEFGFFDILNIDFENNSVTAKWIPSGNRYEIKLDPKVRKISEQGFIQILKSSNTDDSVKNNVEVSKEMEQELKDLKAQLETINASLTAKDTEIASLKQSLDEVKTQLEQSKVEAEAAKSELEKTKTENAKAVEKAAADAKLIAERRAELGEFASKIEDKDLLDEKTYTIAKKDKEIAELKTASNKNEELEAGSRRPASEVTKLNKKVQEFAFGKQ